MAGATVRVRVVVVSDVQFADAAELSSSEQLYGEPADCHDHGQRQADDAKRLLEPDAADVSSDSDVLVTWAPNMKVPLKADRGARARRR